MSNNASTGFRSTLIIRVAIKYLLPAVLSFIFGVLGYISYDYYSKRIQSLEYQVVKSVDMLGNLNEISGDSLVVRFGRSELSTLSFIEIRVINNTSDDFSDVPIFIDLSYSDQSAVKILSTHIYDFNNSKESISVLNASESSSKGGLRFGYLLKIVNRMTNDVPVFRVQYLVESGILPDYKVQTGKLGLGIKEIELSQARSDLEAGLIAFSFIALTFGFAGVFLTFRVRFWAKEFKHDMRRLRFRLYKQSVELSEIEKRAKKD